MLHPTIITFDVYGTLTRWTETVHEVFQEIFIRHGRGDTGVTLAVNAFEAESRRLQTVGAFRSYRGILCDSIVPALATAGLEPMKEDIGTVLGKLSCVPAYSEVPSVLAELARRHQLVPVSNTDDDFLADTLAGLGPVFATTVTAEQARAYKPNPGLFRFALRKLGIDPGNLLHVARGTFSDLAVCSALGIRVVWVNREGEALQRGLDPIAIIDDLSALPGVVAAL